MANASWPAPVLLFATAFWGYWSGVQGAIAPFLASSFGLADDEIARALGWIGTSALGAIALGRGIDRLGRRRAILACLAVLPVCAGASALAPTMEAYVAAQCIAYAFGATLLSAVSVAVAESMPAAGRSQGLGRAGLVFTIATAAPLVLAAFLASAHGSWRWVWAVGALPALAWPRARRALVESARWRAAAGRGETRAVRFTEVFHTAWRGRTSRVLLAMGFANAAETAIRTWLFFHAVRALALDPRHALVVLLAGGALSLAGFRLGGALANRFGRRLTFAAGAALTALGASGYYGLAERDALATLAISFAALAIGGNVATVAFRALATELFPTRLRGALGGWIAGASAAGFVGAMLATGALAPVVGSIGAAVVVVVLLAMPAAAALVAGLPETAGLELDAPALEAAG